MSLDEKGVRNIANLARLAISDEDIAEYQRHLNNIIGFVEQMNRVETGQVQPMAHPQDLPQRLRADEVLETDQRERFQKLAPKVAAGLYLVPQVIE